MSKKIDVVLISPPEIPLFSYKKEDSTLDLNTRLIDKDIQAPLGLSCLAEYLKKHTPFLAVEILDEQIGLSCKAIKNRLNVLKPDFVGISPYFSSYESALEIARFSKSLGAKVIFGGHYAAGAAREILLNRGPSSKDYCVDAVCQQDGEECLADFVRGRSFKKINNLIYWEGGEVKYNPVKNLNLNYLPRQDFSFFDIQKYFKLQKKSRINVFSRKGCNWRLRHGPCYFCSIMYREERYKSPLRFFQELDFCVQKYNPEIFFDVSDDFLDNRDWFLNFHRLYKSYSIKQKPKLQIYSRVSELNSSMIKKLTEINTGRVLLGVESGDNRILSDLKKCCSVDDIKRTVKNMTKAGIIPFVNLIIGGKGETIHTLKNTIKLAEILKDYCPQILFIAHFLKIIPGTAAHRLLLQKTGSKYENRDYFDQYEILRDWLRHFTDISYSQALNALKKILSLNRL